jgi:hypothetical protein
LAITTGSPPSITATHEFVVPKSIPITFDMAASFLLAKIARDFDWSLARDVPERMGEIITS